MHPEDNLNPMFVCDMNALTPDQRQRHGELAKILRPAVVQFVELPTGYAAKFDSNLDCVISEFCNLELLCCPFFSLELAQDECNSVLTITGHGEIKPFIRIEFGIPTTEATDA
jgi:hypothetical protein